MIPDEHRRQPFNDVMPGRLKMKNPACEAVQTRGGRGLVEMKIAQPPSVTIRQIEFELQKAEHGMALPYDAERVGQLRSMLREARKRKQHAPRGAQA
jgi:hypothetical protein